MCSDVPAKDGIHVPAKSTTVSVPSTLGTIFGSVLLTFKYSILPCQMKKNNHNYYSSYSFVSFPQFCVTKLIILSWSYTFRFLYSNFHFLGCNFSVLHIKVVCLMCEVSRLQLLLNYCSVEMKLLSNYCTVW